VTIVFLLAKRSNPLLGAIRAWWLPALLVLAPLRAAGQPADCPSPPQNGPGLDLSIDLAGRPGVPSGLTGQLEIQVPTDHPGYDCPTTPPPHDVLGGEPGDVLHGPPSPDLLRGPGVPRVEVETLAPPR
jgi:hypothetical protein